MELRDEWQMMNFFWTGWTGWTAWTEEGRVWVPGGRGLRREVRKAAGRRQAMGGKEIAAAPGRSRSDSVTGFGGSEAGSWCSVAGSRLQIR